MTECAGNGHEPAGYVPGKCAEIAKSEGLERGFRLITNNGPDACQSVEHMHVHVLGGKQLKDSMG